MDNHDQNLQQVMDTITTLQGSYTKQLSASMKQLIAQLKAVSSSNADKQVIENAIATLAKYYKID